jgi:hypothetical protein
MRYLCSVAFAAVVLLNSAGSALAQPPDRLAFLYPTDLEPDASGLSVFGYYQIGHNLYERFSVHVDGLQDRTSVVVVMPDDPQNPYVGLIELSDGSGDLLRDSGQGDRIPEGSTVWILDAWTGDLLLEGHFE